MALIWKKPERWYMETQCGKYRVSKAIGGNETVFYTAWFDGRALLYTDAPDKAKARCQEHKDTGR